MLEPRAALRMKPLLKYLSSFNILLSWFDPEWLVLYIHPENSPWILCEGPPSQKAFWPRILYLPHTLTMLFSLHFRVWLNSWTGHHVKSSDGGGGGEWWENRARCRDSEKPGTGLWLPIPLCESHQPFLLWNPYYLNIKKIDSILCSWRFLYYFCAFWYGIIVLWDVSTAFLYALSLIYEFTSWIWSDSFHCHPLLIELYKPMDSLITWSYQSLAVSLI